MLQLPQRKGAAKKGAAELAPFFDWAIVNCRFSIVRCCATPPGSFSLFLSLVIYMGSLRDPFFCISQAIQKSSDAGGITYL